MKNLLYLLAFTFFFSVSCDDDPCKGVDCGEKGTCVDGICNCDSGWEGKACGTMIADKFVGDYNASETCTNPNSTNNYSNTISVQNEDELVFSNLNNMENIGIQSDVVARITGTNTFEIISQSHGGITYEGTGSYNENNDKVTVTYTTTNGGTVRSCTAEMTPL